MRQYLCITSEYIPLCDRNQLQGYSVVPRLQMLTYEMNNLYLLHVFIWSGQSFFNFFTLELNHFSNVDF